MPSDSPPKVERQNVSFKFSKISSRTIANRLDDSAIKDFVSSVDKKEIKSSLSKPEVKELVIPLIKKNNWRVKNVKPQTELTEEEKKLKDQAVQELIKESSEQNAAWENRDQSVGVASIPLIVQNMIPEGFETDDRLDVSLRPEESTVDDYDQVPVDRFGLAMLRGMGWKEGDAIGANHKICAAPIEVQLRPKGLGLGADTSALNKKKESQGKSKEEKLELIAGAFVNVVQGPEKGFYGQVMGLDEENARSIVKLSGDEKIKTFPDFFLAVVTKKEFDKESRIINRASYEHYKREREEEEDKLEEKKSKRHKDSHREEKDERKGSRDSTPTQQKTSQSSHKHSKKHRRSRERSVEQEPSRTKKLWVKPQLRVRMIDDKYKNGRYFNQKVVVVDVLSSDSCSCKTDDDKYLDDISPSMLETVIPRSETAYVMIVQGKYRGELCTILKRDKSECIATVQFLSDRNKALKIEYDSICEYVGDIAQYD